MGAVQDTGTEWAQPFGTWLRRERERLGYSQPELAERAGLSVSTLRHYEAGERRHGHTLRPVQPSNKALYGLARALELPPDLVFHAAGKAQEPVPGDRDVVRYYERLDALEDQAAALLELVRELRRSRG